MPKFCEHCGSAIWGQFCGSCGAEGPAAAPPPPPFGAAGPPPGVVPPPPGGGVAPPTPPMANPYGTPMVPPSPEPVQPSRKLSPVALTVGIIGAGLAALVLVLVLMGGGSSGNDGAISGSHHYQYPAQVEDTFVKACTSGGGTEAKCRCALGHLEDSVSYSRFVEMDNEARATGKIPQDALNALQGC